jgi:hypothetical protein
MEARHCPSVSGRSTADPCPTRCSPGFCGHNVHSCCAAFCRDWHVANIGLQCADVSFWGVKPTRRDPFPGFSTRFPSFPLETGFEFDICEFESSRGSQPVPSPWAISGVL